MTRALFLAPLVLCGCFFEFDRGSDLRPGDIAGVVRLIDGTPGALTRVTVEGSARTVRADDEGRFIVRGLSAGTWMLRAEHDVDGDGWVEQSTVRAVLVRDVDGAPVAVDLGEISLQGVAPLRARVVDEDGNAVDNISVAISRVVDDITLGVEARATTAQGGRVFFAALAAGEVLVSVTGEDVAAAELAVDLSGDGQVTDLGDLVLTVIPADFARRANIFVTPAPEDGELVRVDLVPTDEGFPEEDFNEALGNVFVGGDLEQNADGDAVVEIDDLSVGTFRVKVSTSRGRRAQPVPHEVSFSEENLTWGRFELVSELCGTQVSEDCDGDGVAGLPPREGDDDPLWNDCAQQCQVGADYSAADVAGARCTRGGQTFDCEDDLDGQPDTDEPACFRSPDGADQDGDNICDAVDDFPFCAANRADLCDPDDVVGVYGDDEPAPSIDAGPEPDAGPPGNDAGPPNNDAGPPENDAGQPPNNDAGVIDDAGVNDAGLPNFAPLPPFAADLFGTTAAIDGLVREDGSLIFVSEYAESVNNPFGCPEQAPGAGVQLAITGLVPAGACQFILPLQVQSGFLDIYLDGDNFVVALVTGPADLRLGLDVSGTRVDDLGAESRIVIAVYNRDGRVLSHASNNIGSTDQVHAPIFAKPVTDGVAVAAEFDSPTFTLDAAGANEQTFSAGPNARGNFIATFDLDTGQLTGATSVGPEARLATLSEDGAGGLLVTGERQGGTVFGQASSVVEYVARLNADLSLRYVGGATGQNVAVRAAGTSTSSLVVIDTDRGQEDLFLVSVASTSKADAPDDVTLEDVGLVVNGGAMSFHDDDGRLYYNAANGIRRVLPDISGDELVIAEDALELDVAGGRMVWINQFSAVRFCDVTNCAATAIDISAVQTATDVAVDPVGQRLYIADGFSEVIEVDFAGVIQRSAFLTDGDPAPIDVDEVNGVLTAFSTVDGGGCGAEMVQVPVTGGPKTFGISCVNAQPDDVIVDPVDGRVYVSNNTGVLSAQNDGPVSTIASTDVFGIALVPTAAPTFIDGTGASFDLVPNQIFVGALDDIGARGSLAPILPVPSDTVLFEVSAAADRLVLIGGLNETTDFGAGVVSSLDDLRSATDTVREEIFVASLVPSEGPVVDWVTASETFEQVIPIALSTRADGAAFVVGAAIAETSFGSTGIVGPGGFVWFTPATGDVQETPASPAPNARLDVVGQVEGDIRLGRSGTYVVREADNGVVRTVDLTGANLWTIDLGSGVTIDDVDVARSGFVGITATFNNPLTFNNATFAPGLGQTGYIFIAVDSAGQTIFHHFAATDDGIPASVAIAENGALFAAIETFSNYEVDVGEPTAFSGSTLDGYAILQQLYGIDGTRAVAGQQDAFGGSLADIAIHPFGQSALTASTLVVSTSGGPPFISVERLNGGGQNETVIDLTNFASIKAVGFSRFGGEIMAVGETEADLGAPTWNAGASQVPVTLVRDNDYAWIRVDATSLAPRANGIVSSSGGLGTVDIIANNTSGGTVVFGTALAGTLDANGFSTSLSVATTSRSAYVAHFSQSTFGSEIVELKTTDGVDVNVHDLEAYGDGQIDVAGDFAGLGQATFDGQQLLAPDVIPQPGFLWHIPKFDFANQ